MSPYIGREVSKLWMRICAETTTELNLLAENWKYLVTGLIFQYAHGVAARAVHYFHRPGPILQDAGFLLLLELGQENAYISETACQFLRIITFYSTQLPGPNYHCREGSNLATLPPPNSVLEVFIVNFPRGVLYGCGDLIFSSHMIFTLVFVRTYQKHGTKRLIKQFAWLIAVIQSFLIVASRKHYTVDVVVAWYTVNLVVSVIDYKLPELPDRTGAAAFLLPMRKDGRMKEENLKHLNGNSGDSVDQRVRAPVHGKVLEEASSPRQHYMNVMGIVRGS